MVGGEGWGPPKILVSSKDAIILFAKIRCELYVVILHNGTHIPELYIARLVWNRTLRSHMS